jgi:hypothetical protein
MIGTTLGVGKAVFNYEFGALKEETPIIKAVYRVLRESEHRSTFPLQYWNIPGAMDVVGLCTLNQVDP